MSSIGDFKLRPLLKCIGVEVSGLDLECNIGNEVSEYFVDILHEFQLLLFRGQLISNNAFSEFGNIFGEFEDYNKFDRVQGTRIHTITEMDTHNEGWHSDGLYYGRHLRAVLLHAQDVPEYGGDTLWSSLYGAYDGLSAKMKEHLDGLTVRYEFASVLARAANKKFLALALERSQGPVDIPVVCTNEHTRRKHLFFFEGFAVRVNEVDERESKWLLQFLAQHIDRHEFVYRHRWKAGDLIVWDNRTTLHRAVYDFEGCRKLNRLMII